MSKPKVVYFTVSGQFAGQGHTIRALSIRNALKRANLLDKIDFILAGLVDNPDLWPDKANLYCLDTNMLDINDKESSNRAALACCDLIASIKPDILLVDVYYHFLLPLLADETKRPPNVWLISRFTFSLQGKNPGAVDRIYMIEPFHPMLIEGHLAKEKCRSANEKAGVMIPATPEYNEYRKSVGLEPSDYFEQEPYNPDTMNYQDWLLRVQKSHYKLIPRIVNIDDSKVLSKAEAKTYLVGKYNIDPDKPLCLVIGRTKWMREQDRAFFDVWALNQVPDNCQRLDVGVNGVTIPELYRVMPAADYILSTAGYNTFSEIYYLKETGKLDAKVQFYGLRQAQEDQVWRANHAEGFLKNKPGYETPKGNGADFMATALGIKLGLLEATHVTNEVYR